MKVTLQPSGAVLETQPGEAILAAAQRLGYSGPHSCRNGNCQLCAALLVEGQVAQHGQTVDHGEIYVCVAVPLSDCLLQWDGVLAPGELPVRQLACRSPAASALAKAAWGICTAMRPSSWCCHRKLMMTWLSRGMSTRYKLTGTLANLTT